MRMRLQRIRPRLRHGLGLALDRLRPGRLWRYLLGPALTAVAILLLLWAGFVVSPWRAPPPPEEPPAEASREPIEIPAFEPAAGPPAGASDLASLSSSARLEPAPRPSGPTRQRLGRTAPPVAGSDATAADAPVIDHMAPDGMTPKDRPEPAPRALLPVPLPRDGALPEPEAPPSGEAGEAGVAAIIIDDLGHDMGAFRRTLALPARLTLAFLPYTELAPAMAEEARASGHEILLHMPMEPMGEADPGPNAIRVGLAPEENRKRLRWALDRLGRVHGVNSHMGSRVTADDDAMEALLSVLSAEGLPFIDSRTTADSVVEKVAADLGIASLSRDVFLDHHGEAAAIEAALARVERLAAKHGRVVAIGHPYPATLDALARWLPEAQARGLEVVPLTRLLAPPSCPEGRRPCPPPPLDLSLCAGERC